MKESDWKVFKEIMGKARIELLLIRNEDLADENLLDTLSDEFLQQTDPFDSESATDAPF